MVLAWCLWQRSGFHNCCNKLWFSFGIYVCGKAQSSIIAAINCGLYLKEMSVTMLKSPMSFLRNDELFLKSTAFFGKVQRPIIAVIITNFGLCLFQNSELYYYHNKAHSSTIALIVSRVWKVYLELAVLRVVAFLRIFSVNVITESNGLLLRCYVFG